MAKRLMSEQTGKPVLPSPGLRDAPVLDLMCSHFVLTLAARRGSNFNVRRDLNSVVGLAGRHLVWPAPVLGRVREFLARRCVGNEYWRGHESLRDAQFVSDPVVISCHRAGSGPEPPIRGSPRCTAAGP